MTLMRITDKRPDAEIQKAIDATIRDAETEWAPLKFEGEYPINGFGISEIRPHHIGYGVSNGSVDSWLMSTGAASYGSSVWTLWISKDVDERAYLVITGFFCNTANPGVAEFQIECNGQDLPIMNVEQAYGLDVARVWFEKPFIIKPYGHLEIKVYSRLEQAEYLGLLGYTVAKRAYLIET